MDTNLIHKLLGTLELGDELSVSSDIEIPKLTVSDIKSVDGRYRAELSGEYNIYN